MHRILFAAVTIVVASAAFLFALSGTIGARSPALAASLPFGEHAGLRVLDRTTAAGGTTVPPSELLPLVRRSIAVAPLDANALRMLSISYALTGQARRALSLALLSQQVSRRELSTQVVLIEDAVQRQRIGEALQHYDIALRASPRNGKPLLYPVLSAALDNADIRTAMIPYAERGTPWMAEFISYAATTGSMAGPAADIMLHGNPALRDQVAGLLLTRLVQQGEFARAKRLLLRQPGVTAGTVETASFTAQSTDPGFGVMAWQPVTNADVTVTLSGRGDAREATVFAGPAANATAMTRLLFLPPGAYAWSQRSTVRTNEPDAHMYWQMACVGKGARPLWSSANILALGDQLRQAGPVVPPGCDQQTLALTVDAGEGQRGLDMTIADLRIAQR